MFRKNESKDQPALRRPAPIIESRYDRRIDEEYRFPNDPPNVIRILQVPEGFPTPMKIFEYVNVDGLYEEDMRNNVNGFIIGINRKIELKRDPTNKLNKNTIKVIGVWNDKDKNIRRGQIGWVPDHLAEETANMSSTIRLIATLRTIYQETKYQSQEIRIHIWGQRQA